ncbi:MAG: hypothetical protein IT462_12925 [Planctomycetes bacterium]|nr:hypothetical protein [Planctomycetota bacterium]
MSRLLIAAASLMLIGLLGIPANANGDKPRDRESREEPTAELLKDAVKGDPGIQSIQCMSFGPKGLLLIGDGKGAQLVAIQTADIKPLGEFKKLTGLHAKLAAKFKLRASDIMVTAYAANRESGCAYFAINRQDGRGHMLAQVKPDGSIEEIKLNDVTYSAVKINMPKAAGNAIFNALLYTPTQIVASATADASFAAHVMTVPVPFKNECTVVSASSFHVTHGGWETNAPLEKMALWEEGGESYIVAGLTCTPVVKYALKDIKQGAQLKGKTPFDFGGGQQPIDMFVAGGALYCNVDGWEEPYVVRISKDLIAGGKGIDEKAPTITQEKDGRNELVKSVASMAQVVPKLAKAEGLMPLGDKQVLVMRVANGDMELEAVTLETK